MAKRKIWHFTPSLPLKNAPYYEWPPRPVKAALYLLKSWNPVGQRLFMLAVACLVWFYFTPDLARMESFRPDWIFEVWLRNFIILFTVAGGLHLWLFRQRGQRDDYHYDTRPMARNAKLFHFNDQVKDNIFWSFMALQFWTFWECLTYWAYANGILSMIEFDTHPVQFILMIVFIPIWAGMYFYFHHRLLHTPWLYKHVHSWHHKNINIGPWSGMAMHPVESFILFTDCLIFLLLASHPIHAIFLALHHGMGAPVSHAGFDKLRIGKVAVPLGDFYHQLHHKFFDCNYGTEETPWDEWFGTFHDGTPEGDVLIQERRRKLNAARS